ncbi:MAG: glycosyltransferase [Desulfobacteraceae bacterium]|nr:glycosyltransferase [Desulfobacteraceae bacterium]
MRRKKILQVIERFDVAGAETVVRDLVVNLPASEWETEVCVLQNIGRLGAELKAQGYPIHHLNWKYDTQSQTRIIGKLHALIKARQIDLLHSHSTAAWYFASLARIPMTIGHCVTLHGFNWGKAHWKMSLMCAVLSRLTDTIVIVSDGIREYLKTIPLLR